MKFRPSHFSAAFAAAALLGSLLSPSISRADLVYRPNEGWSRIGGIFGGHSSRSSVSEKTADLQLEYARGLESKGNRSGAKKAYKDLLSDFSLSQQTAEARLRLGAILEAEGRWEEAFETYDQLLQKNPESKEFTSALDAMIAIGKRYMGGEKRRLFGIKTFSSNQRAEEMFDTILKRAPYARSSPQVMLYKGMVLERQGKDPEALAAYQQILERFPSDPIADEAQFQIGYVRMRGVKRGSYDSVDRSRAQESFEDYLNRAPANGKMNQARENLQNLETKSRKASLETAKFYEKTGKTKAAAIYYKDILRDHPGSEEAKVAANRLEALKASLGADAVNTRPQAPENADKAIARKQMEAKVNTVSRPDYVGPKLKPEAPVNRAPASPGLRLSPEDVAPPAGTLNPAAVAEPLFPLPSPRLTPPNPQSPQNP